MNLLEELKGAKSIAIGGHIRPDGDCVGSCMSAYLYIKKAMPDVDVDVYLESIPESFYCIKSTDEIKQKIDETKQYDAFIVLDCDYERLGFSEPLYQSAKKKINIDHHISNKGCGDVHLVMPKASSACEVLYSTLDEKYIDEAIAKALYIGIINDCGVFQYSNTSPETLRIAADLITYGFDFTKIIDETFNEMSYIQNQLLGRVLLDSIRFMNNRCIVGKIDKKTMDFYQATSKDLDGIVSILRNTKGVDCAIFMHEMEHGEYKISMRSNERVDVSKIAQVFGGGGHMRAAGCSMRGTFHDIVNNLSKYIEMQLN